jgi:hypothetical protein
MQDTTWDIVDMFNANNEGNVVGKNQDKKSDEVLSVLMPSIRSSDAGHH